MLKIRTKDIPIGIFIGFIFGVSILLLLFFTNTDKFYLRFPFETNQKNKDSKELVLASKNLEKGHIIDEDDFVLDNSDVFKNTYVDSKYLIGKKTKISISENMPITYEMLEDEKSDYKGRIYEVDFATISNNIEQGSLVDLRISFPNGDDFTILSKKEVVDISEEKSGDNSFVSFILDEKDILMLSSAYNDYKLLDGVDIYMAKYLDGEKQERASENYPVNKFVASLIKSNTAIKDKDVNDKRDLLESCFESQLRLNSNLDDTAEDDYEYELGEDETDFDDLLSNDF